MAYDTRMESRERTRTEPAETSLVVGEHYKRKEGSTFIWNAEGGKGKAQRNGVGEARWGKG